MSSTSTFTPGGQRLVTPTKAKEVPVVTAPQVYTVSATITIDCSKTSSIFKRLYQMFRFILTGKMSI